MRPPPKVVVVDVVVVVAVGVVVVVVVVVVDVVVGVGVAVGVVVAAIIWFTNFYPGIVFSDDKEVATLGWFLFFSFINSFRHRSTKIASFAFRRSANCFFFTFLC